MSTREIINFGDYNSLDCVSNLLVVSNNELEVEFNICNLVGGYPVLVSGSISYEDTSRVGK